MIYGIGTDLCDVGRIEKSIARPAFLQHVYTPAEQELIVAFPGSPWRKSPPCASQAVRLTWNLPVKPPVSWRRTICRLI